MGDQFLGEIRLFPFGVVPRGWQQCNGQSLPVSQNQALYALLGNRFGGNATTFQLPDLRGRVMVSQGKGAGSYYTLGQIGGQDYVALTDATMPTHIHNFNGTAAAATVASPAGGLLAAATNGAQLYSSGTGSLQALTPESIANNGAATPHENRQPYLALNFCIAVQGVWPQRQ